jgi:DNA-binding sugar fermentation-stimulating protein
MGLDAQCDKGVAVCIMPIARAWVTRESVAGVSSDTFTHSSTPNQGSRAAISTVLEAAEAASSVLLETYVMLTVRILGEAVPRGSTSSQSNYKGTAGRVHLGQSRWDFVSAR